MDVLNEMVNMTSVSCTVLVVGQLSAVSGTVTVLVCKPTTDTNPS